MFTDGRTVPCHYTSVFFCFSKGCIKREDVCLIAPDKMGYQINISLMSIKIYVLGTHQMYLGKLFLMSTTM